MNNWLVPSLIVFFAWRICNLRDASAAVRVIREFKNSSAFVHHALEKDESADPSEDLKCQNQVTNITVGSIAIEEAVEKRRRSHGNVEENSTETTTINVEDLYSDELLNCEEPQTKVEKNCINKFPNGSVYVPLYKRLFGPRDYIEDDNGDIFVCSAFFDDHVDAPKFAPALAIVTVVGIVVSTLCIVLHITMFLFLEKLRNLPGYCLFSMCIALLVAYTCTFIPLSRKEPSDCTAVGIIKAYSFLASFFWMNVMSYDIWRSLRMATAKLRLTGQRPMMARFAMYSAYSWGCPLVIIVIGFIVNSIDGNHDLYRLVISDDMCWFQHKPALQVYFAFPLFALLILNLILFVSSFLMINSATMNTSENRADLWSRFLVSMRLAVVMGLMWTFGVLATATEAEWLWYFYVLCNVLQGMFIFFSFTLTEKTRKECRKALASKKSSVFRTLTTLQSSSTSV